MSGYHADEAIISLLPLQDGPVDILHDALSGTGKDPTLYRLLWLTLVKGRCCSTNNVQRATLVICDNSVVVNNAVITHREGCWLSENFIFRSEPVQYARQASPFSTLAEEELGR